MDLSKELHPISYYISDKEEMLDQVFSVVGSAKLKAMLTSSLRDLELSELKLLCLDQLEGLSKKRIKYILAGKSYSMSFWFGTYTTSRQKRYPNLT